ncbi:hypothetical protein VPH35_089730 [Triticum aestivum]
MEELHSPFHPGVSRVFYKHVAGNPPKSPGQGEKVHVTRPRSARFFPLQQPDLQNSVEPEGARRKWDQTTNVLRSMHKPGWDPPENPPAHWPVPPPAPPGSLSRWLRLSSRAARLRSEKRSWREKRAFFPSFPCPPPSLPLATSHLFRFSPPLTPPRPAPLAPGRHSCSSRAPRRVRDRGAGVVEAAPTRPSSVRRPLVRHKPGLL